MRTAAAEVTLAEAVGRLRRWVDRAGADRDTFALIRSRTGDEGPCGIPEGDELLGLVAVFKRKMPHAVDPYLRPDK